MRLRYYHAFDGITYWDDISIIPLGSSALVGTGIEDEYIADELPNSFELHQNYPNPFNPVTVIAFDMADQGKVTLSVYNMLGQRVTTLVDGVRMPAGRHTATFDASSLSSGVYLYVLDVSGQMLARRMVLLK
ncbi:MAG: T9SS type A sorting domain-containing protein [Bacteroidetes bacterium]|nr:T9SS type A sorting domain-containing protein [Bacteroidota bacterium]